MAVFVKRQGCQVLFPLAAEDRTFLRLKLSKCLPTIWLWSIGGCNEEAVLF
jgi:hypothetical protein